MAKRTKRTATTGKETGAKTRSLKNAASRAKYIGRTKSYWARELLSKLTSENLHDTAYVLSFLEKNNINLTNSEVYRNRAIVLKARGDYKTFEERRDEAFNLSDVSADALNIEMLNIAAKAAKQVGGISILKSLITQIERFQL